MKSPAMSFPGKDPIPNQDSNRIINEQDPIITPLLEEYSTGYKSIFNYTHYPNQIEDDLNDSKDNSRTDVDNYLNKLNVKKYDYKDNEYKDDSSQDINSNESLINNTEVEKALTYCLMSMGFLLKFLIM